jgi:hypothetical protein
VQVKETVRLDFPPLNGKHQVITVTPDGSLSIHEEDEKGQRSARSTVSRPVWSWHRIALSLWGAER